MKLRILYILALVLISPPIFAQYRQTAHGPAMEPPPPKPVIEQVGIDQHLDAQIPLDAPFRDETGRSVRLDDYFHTNRPVVLALVYYGCPMLCTMELNGLTGALRTMSLNANSDYDVLVVSFDPTETPALAAEKKANYLKQYNRPNASPGWHFLTGDQPSIDRLTHAVGFRYYKDPLSNQYAHASGIMVLTPTGLISKYFYGIDYSPRDLRFGLVQASQGSIGTLADSLILLCYHYDPTKARYGLAIMRLLQVGGILTLLAITSFVLIQVRRDHRRREVLA